MKATEYLIEKAQSYVTRVESNGGDWQQAVWEILNSPSYNPLFAGKTEDEIDEILKDISLGKTEDLGFAE